MAERAESVAEALSGVTPGSRLGVGGMLVERRPVRALVELAQLGVTDLEVVTLTGSIETDLAVGLGGVRTVRSCFVSLGLFGLAPALAAGLDTGAVAAPADTEMSIIAGLRAAIAGVGFLPMRAWHGTDFAQARPDVAVIRCPYSDEELVAFPALSLDVAIVHVPFADSRGNAAILSDPGIDQELLRAAKTRIVTAERIISTDELRAAGGSALLGFDVDIVAEVPNGAAPTGCRPHYRPNWEAFEHYVDWGSRDPDAFAKQLLGAS